MAKDRFGYGTNKISDKEFKQAWKNEMGIMHIMKNPEGLQEKYPKAARFEMNPNRKNLKIITQWLMEDKRRAANLLKSEDEQIVEMRRHLYPEEEENRWGMDEKEWNNRNRHKLSPMRLFS